MIGAGGSALTLTVAEQVAVADGLFIVPVIVNMPAAAGFKLTLPPAIIGVPFTAAVTIGPPVDCNVTLISWPRSIELKLVVSLHAGFSMAGTTAIQVRVPAGLFTEAFNVAPEAAQADVAVHLLTPAEVKVTPARLGGFEIGPPVEPTETVHCSDVLLIRLATIEQLGATVRGTDFALTETVAAQFADERGFVITPVITNGPATVGVNVTALSMAIGEEFMVVDVAGPPVERMITSTVWPISMEARFVVSVQAGAGISATEAEHSAEREIFFTCAAIVPPSAAHSTWPAQPLSFLVKDLDLSIKGSSEIAPPVEVTKMSHRVEVAFSLVALIEQLGATFLSATAFAQFKVTLEFKPGACSRDWQVSGLSVSMRVGPVN